MFLIKFYKVIPRQLMSKKARLVHKQAQIRLLHDGYVVLETFLLDGLLLGTSLFSSTLHVFGPQHGKIYSTGVFGSRGGALRYRGGGAP